MDSNRNQFGLTGRDWQTITNILSRLEKKPEVHIFGSRAIGNYRDGSDIDLVIMNQEFDRRDLINLQAAFEESDLPYHVDVLHYYNIKNPDLKNHIDRVGIKLEL